MLYFHKQKLIVLCQPKTGTTALHEAISAEASIAFNTPPHMKHMTYAKFMNALATWIAGGGMFHRGKFTFVSVMREPLEWLGSWYRYNSREALASPDARSHSRYTGNISYDQYLKDMLLPRDEAPDYAKLGGPCSVSQDGNGRIAVDYLFRYTDLDNMVDFIASKLGRSIELPKANISQQRELEADPATIERVKQKLAFDYAVYEKLRPDGRVTKELQTFSQPAKTAA